MRRSPENHLVEQILGLGERFLPGFALAPAVRQVGEIDDEPAFRGRDRIDGPNPRIGQPFHASLLSAGCEATIVCNQRGSPWPDLVLIFPHKSASDNEL
jgi:hypothetical protein